MGTPSPTDPRTSITTLEMHRFKVVSVLTVLGYQSVQGATTHRPSSNTCALPPTQNNDIGQTVLFQARFKAEEDTANTLHVCGATIQTIMVWFIRLRT